jgi:hypothetical protein
MIVKEIDSKHQLKLKKLLELEKFNTKALYYNSRNLTTTEKLVKHNMQFKPISKRPSLQSIGNLENIFGSQNANFPSIIKNSRKSKEPKQIFKNDIIKSKIFRNTLKSDRMQIKTENLNFLGAEITDTKDKEGLNFRNTFIPTLKGRSTTLNNSIVSSDIQNDGTKVITYCRSNEGIILTGRFLDFKSFMKHKKNKPQVVNQGTNTEFLFKNKDLKNSKKQRVLDSASNLGPDDSYSAFQFSSPMIKSNNYIHRGEEYKKRLNFLKNIQSNNNVTLIESVNNSKSNYLLLSMLNGKC